ncbi:MAG: undecaprenyl-diphosphate phosphatase [Desulfamplus sp.]|nr:undecaprenyl-diphosphate phosphatase [Desulfamplus sp.]
MEIYQAIILGVLQGLTEFLPVSSSGHLALGHYILGITEPTLFFDVSLHVGTLIAVIVVFFKDIRDITASLWGLIRHKLHRGKFPGEEGFFSRAYVDPNIRFAILIIVASVPTAFMGLFFKQYMDAMSDSINFVGCMMLVTGTFLWLTRGIKPSGAGIMAMGYKRALLIGICQGLAVIPGISRSGATISAALFSGMDRETAARFSFLLSIPAILGAELISLRDFVTQGIAFDFSILYGTLISFVVGYAALKLLIHLVKNGRFYLFAPYCWIVGGFAIIIGVF